MGVWLLGCRVLPCSPGVVCNGIWPLDCIVRIWQRGCRVLTRTRWGIICRVGTGIAVIWVGVGTGIAVIQVGVGTGTVIWVGVGTGIAVIRVGVGTGTVIWVGVGTGMRSSDCIGTGPSFVDFVSCCSLPSVTFNSSDIITIVQGGSKKVSCCIAGSNFVNYWSIQKKITIRKLTKFPARYILVVNYSMQLWVLWVPGAFSWLQINSSTFQHSPVSLQTSTAHFQFFFQCRRLHRFALSGVLLLLLLSSIVFLEIHSTSSSHPIFSQFTSF